MADLKKIKRIALRIILALCGLVVLLYLILTAPFWWRHWVTYPQLEKARAAIWTKYQPTLHFSEKTDYKGVLHAHSYWSHDSRGVLSEILPAAKKAKLDFIFFSDHIRNDLDTFPRSYHGIYEGIIMESGTETRQLMVTPMKDTILNWDMETAQVIKAVVQSGGFVGYVHSEEEHDWDNPDYHAMEIYNIHTDLLDEKKSFLLKMLLNTAINGKRYRHWTYRELFDVQQEILARWDTLNQSRRIVGFSAVDAHNNQGIKARYTENGQVEWVGPNAKTIKVVKPGWKERWLLSEPDEAGWAFKWELDTYFESFNFTNTYVFCDTFSNRNIIDNLIQGHAFISFENLAEAKGFQFFALDSTASVSGIMGDSLSVNFVDKLVALSPFPVKFTMVKDGVVLDEVLDVYSYEFDPKHQAGNYRIEASLSLLNKWVPWVYTNPIYLHEN